MQNPHRAFTSAEFAEATFAVHPRFQVPIPASGWSAVVFRADVHGIPRALRFFTRDPDSDRVRYDAVLHHLERQDPSGHVVRAHWHDDAVVVDGRTWPLVEMDWIEGVALDRYLNNLVDAGERRTLAYLPMVWRAFLADLQQSGFAHGRLEHSNVLVDGSGMPRLVDLDDVWVDGLSSPPGPYAGHANYDHPNRAWGRWMDTFPALVIYMSLRAVAVSPELWERFYVGDNLIFERADFGSFTTPVWQAVEALHDPLLDLLVARIKGIFGSRPPEASLEAVLAGRADTAPSGSRLKQESVMASQPVFISYAREDQERAQELDKHLRAEGRATWLDTTGTVGGQDWIEQVVAAIRRASALVLVITKRSMTSRSVRREAHYADEHDVAVIPVVLEDVDFPAWYSFAFGSVHRVDGSGAAGMRRAAKDIVAMLDER